MGRACTSMVDIRNSYVLVGKLKGRDHLEDPRVDGNILNITMNLREIAREGVDWMHLAQNSVQWRALVNTIMSLRVPLKAGNLFTI
jgi:hypothetical protein